MSRNPSGYASRTFHANGAAPQYQHLCSSLCTWKAISACSAAQWSCLGLGPITRHLSQQFLTLLILLLHKFIHCPGFCHTRLWWLQTGKLVYFRSELWDLQLGLWGSCYLLVWTFMQVLFNFGKRFHKMIQSLWKTLGIFLRVTIWCSKFIPWNILKKMENMCTNQNICT